MAGDVGCALRTGGAGSGVWSPGDGFAVKRHGGGVVQASTTMAGVQGGLIGAPVDGAGLASGDLGAQPRHRRDWRQVCAA